MNTAEAACVVIGADVIFNNGLLTNKLIDCFHNVIKLYFDSKKPVTYIVSQEELVDAGFGC